MRGLICTPHTLKNSSSEHFQTSSSSKTSHLPTVTTWVLPRQISHLPPLQTPSLRISCIGVVIFSLGLREFLFGSFGVGGRGRKHHKAFLRMMLPPWSSMEKLTKKMIFGFEKNLSTKCRNSWKCWWEILSSVTDSDGLPENVIALKRMRNQNFTSSTYRRVRIFSHASFILNFLEICL